MNGQDETVSILKNLALEFLSVAVLILAVSFPFISSFSPDKTISKLYLIKEIDYLQRQDKNGHYNEISSDPSTSICHVPNECFQAAQPYAPPLWNNLSACGRPVAGDFQTLIYSFFHSIFPAGNKGLESYGILAKIILSATGAYLLARLSGVSKIASQTAGIAYALSPHCLLFTELVNNYCFYPWMLAAAHISSSKLSITSSLAFAIFLAACAYNMHPETFAIGTACAVIYAFLRLCSKAETPQIFLENRVTKAFLWASSVAALVFLLTAPLILPFLEFIASGVSYKFQNFENVHIEFVNLASYITNLPLPLNALSPATGPVLAMLAIAGLLISWKKQKSLVLIFLSLFIFTTRPGALESLFALKPISYLLPEYTLYMCVLLLALFAATGLDSLIKGEIRNASLELKATFAAAALMIIASIAFIIQQSSVFLELLSQYTDISFTSTNISALFLITAAASAGILFVLLYLRPGASIRTASILVLCLLNSLPLILFAPQVLNSTDRFAYKEDSILHSLKTLQSTEDPPKSQSENLARITATGAWLLQPNSNLIFGIDDFRCSAPLHPKRYARLIELAGIVSSNCNIYDSPATLNHVYDLASVKYIISNSPVHSLNPAQKSAELGPAIGFEYDRKEKLAAGLRLESAKLNYHPQAKEIEGNAAIRIHRRARNNFVYRLSLKDSKGSTLWQSAFKLAPIEYQAKAKTNQIWELPLQAPLPLSYEGKFNVELQIGQYLADKIQGPELLLASIDTRAYKSEAASGSKNTMSSANKARSERTGNAQKSEEAESVQIKRLVRKAASPDNFLQIYQNRNALPHAYIVHEIIKSKNEAESLALIEKSRNLDFHRAAVIESKEAETLNPAGSANGQPQEIVRILDRDADSLSIYAVNHSPGYLILTDTFYPGWQAFIDGKPSKIYPANYAFRAVYLDKPGKHQLVFAYEPQTYIWGCRLLFAGLTITFALFLFALLRQKYVAKAGMHKSSSALALEACS